MAGSTHKSYFLLLVCRHAGTLKSGYPIISELGFCFKDDLFVIQLSFAWRASAVLLMHPPALIKTQIEPLSLLPNTGRSDAGASQWQVNWLGYKFVYTHVVRTRTLPRPDGAHPFGIIPADTNWRAC